MGQDQRRYPRARVELDVRAEAAGREWHGKTVDLSVGGVKIAPLSRSVSLVSTGVQLWLSLPDQDAPLALTAAVERVDTDGITLTFVDLGEDQLRRLKHFLEEAHSLCRRSIRPAGWSETTTPSLASKADRAWGRAG